MSNTPTRNFSLTAELDSYIRCQVSTGRYSNASEVVRAGLRLLIEREPQQGAHPSSTPKRVARSNE